MKARPPRGLQEGNSEVPPFCWTTCYRRRNLLLRTLPTEPNSRTTLITAAKSCMAGQQAKRFGRTDSAEALHDPCASPTHPPCGPPAGGKTIPGPPARRRRATILRGAKALQHCGDDQAEHVSDAAWQRRVSSRRRLKAAADVAASTHAWALPAQRAPLGRKAPGKVGAQASGHRSRLAVTRQARSTSANVGDARGAALRGRAVGARARRSASSRRCSFFSWVAA